MLNDLYRDRRRGLLVIDPNGINSRNCCRDRKLPQPQNIESSGLIHGVAIKVLSPREGPSSRRRPAAFSAAAKARLDCPESH